MAGHFYNFSLSKPWNLFVIQFDLLVYELQIKLLVPNKQHLRMK